MPGQILWQRLSQHLGCQHPSYTVSMEFQLLCFQPSSRLMCLSSTKWSEYLCLCHSCGRHGWSSKLLTCAWLISSYCGSWGVNQRWKSYFSVSLSLCYSNINEIAKTYINERLCDRKIKHLDSKIWNTLKNKTLYQQLMMSAKQKKNTEN